MKTCYPKFIICNSCFWSASYLTDIVKLPKKCPICKKPKINHYREVYSSLSKNDPKIRDLVVDFS
jgi:predicted Zn-ribbon and HTH transcriptional regulator